MRNDITTLENRLKAMTDYRKLMAGALKAAIRTYNQFNEEEKARAFGAVSEVNRIRHEIYEKASDLGYVERCMDSIPVCKGECCKWHFPKKLDVPELVITVCGTTVAEQTALADQLAVNNGKYQCPVLRKSGCLLSFHNRPLVCANAYPCFAGAPYHEFLKKQRKKINVQYVSIKEILHSYMDLGAPDPYFS
ncbi:MAG: hypothetical protein JRI75_12340 [Deltaproteobacteria bacterium]|nr:hypothetical protein [Deltaproteobacteria bacterium]